MGKGTSLMSDQADLDPLRKAIWTLVQKSYDNGRERTPQSDVQKEIAQRRVDRLIAELEKNGN